uniref:ATP-grasp domain-containing protein n=1 Tax=Setaria viridis TaxID=4556 RepID=A0A4V6D730_SETVI|nr:hypothetical protein SEVIR_5G315566v2 [Setaria viridis]
MILHRSLSSSTAATPPAEDDDFATGKPPPPPPPKFLRSLGEFSGQLGKMLCQAASQMGIMIVILDPLQDCPASSVCHEHVVGSFNDGDTVREFAKRCGVLIVEIEHVDAVTLEKLEKQGVDCEPKASTIMIIQDRYRQKNHFSKFGIPLPDFMEVDTLHSIEEAGERFGYPLMVKSKRLAYDGRGNAVAQNKEELSSVVACKGVFGYEVLNFNSVTSDVRMLIRRTKYELIIKLIADPFANSRDESIKPN